MPNKPPPNKPNVSIILIAVGYSCPGWYKLKKNKKIARKESTLNTMAPHNLFEL